MVSATVVDEALVELARTRPLFHSEADFQHALAWMIRERLADWSVRLEYPIPWDGPRAYADIWLRGPSGSVAIELKYWKRSLIAQIGDEPYALRNQAAQDISRYDFARDLQRLERIVASGLTHEGHIIALTNDQGYWRVGRQGTVDAAFRLHEGRELRGVLSWAPNTGAGTMKGRAGPIHN